MSTERDTDDKTYDEARFVTLGSVIGQMFMGLIESGMTRLEALEVVKTYVYGLAIKPQDDAA